MQTETLKVTGMTCGGCTSSVTKALKSITGVGDVVVSLSRGEAAVSYDEKSTSLEQLKASVENAGYGVGTTNSEQKPQPQSKGGCCC